MRIVLALLTLQPLLSGKFCPQAEPQEEIRKWIQQLVSDSPDVRAEAEARLAAAGSGAVPALEKATQGSDPELRPAAAAVLHEIARRERIRPYRPAPLRLSLTLEKEPFPSALERISRPFGLTRVDYRAPLKERTISLRLERATVWEAFSEFCRVGHCDIENLISGRHLRGALGEITVNAIMLGPQTAFRHLATSDTEEARVVLESGAAEVDGTGRPITDRLVFHVILPPRTWVDQVEMAELIASDETGRRIDAPFDNAWFDCRRFDGIPTRVRAGTASIAMTDLEGVKTLKVAGKMVLRLPEEIESIPAVEGDGKSSLGIPGARIAIEWRPHKMEFSCTAEGITGKDALHFQLSAFDAGGNWLFDLSPFRIRPGVGFSHPSTQAVDSPPDRVSAWRVTRTSSRTIPFNFADVRTFKK